MSRETKNEAASEVAMYEEKITEPVEKTVDLTVEAQAQKHDIPAPVFAAVMQAQGWASGKAVSEKEFLGAVKDFLGAPMNKGGCK